jgi:hypothetical protein
VEASSSNAKRGVKKNHRQLYGGKNNRWERFADHLCGFSKGIKLGFISGATSWQIGGKSVTVFLQQEFLSDE